MDIVLGVSMAPSSIQIVLLQGENADGATIDENELVVTPDESPTISASDRVVAAIVSTRDDASSAGLELSSVGVACTDKLEAAALREALAAHEIQNVMLVSAVIAATALTQSVGGAMGYDSTAMLFIEPDTATLAVVETTDGSVVEVHREQLHNGSGQIDCAELTEIVAGLDALPTRPGGLFVIGRGVDIAPIRRCLEGATSLTVNAPEEPETALARGAALASAYALASPTAALAYAQDPGTGAVDASDLPGYLSIADAGEDEVAYSAVADEEAGAPTVVIADAAGANESRRRPKLLVGSVIAVAGFSAALALEIALTVGVHTTVGLLPAPLHNFLAPAEQLLAPIPQQVAAAPAAAPKPLNPPAAALPPAAAVPAAPPPGAPIPAAPPVPVPLVLPPMAPAPAPPVQLPNPPASPPMVQAPQQPSPPAQQPPIYSPPPQSPPSHQTPPGQGPNPGNPGDGGPVNGPGPIHGNPGSGGPNPGNPGGGGPVNGPGPGHGHPGSGGPHGDPGGGPVNGPGPGHGNPGSGGPHDGGPANGPGPSHGTPGGAPPEGNGPVGGGGPHDGGPASGPGPSHGTPGGAPPEGNGPAGGGGEPHSGGPIGGAETPGSGGPVGGGAEAGPGNSGGSSAETGGGVTSGGAETGGGTSSGADTGGSTSIGGDTGGSSSSGADTGGSSSSGADTGGSSSSSSDG